jgi:hypothetical protein
MRYGHTRSLQKDKQAVSPAVSTVILTAAVIVMILVAMGFANNFLDARMAENEFSTNKQFMLTTGLQIDDIAWTIGRTQTVRYSSQYGNMKFQSLAVNYTFEIDTGSGLQPLFSNATGMILLPSSNGSFLQQGSSAPVGQVFCVEKLPMIEGNYTRIVAVPSIRMLNSTIEGLAGIPTKYYRFYMPSLMPGNHQYRSQSITMTGNDITKIIRNDVNQVRINVSFPIAASGFDADFFNFDHISETVTLLPGSVVEFYIGKVIVTLGQV